MELRTVKVKELQPGDWFMGEEDRPGQRPSRIRKMEIVVSVTPCHGGTSTEYVCDSGQLYLGRSESDIDVWR